MDWFGKKKTSDLEQHIMSLRASQKATDEYNKELKARVKELELAHEHETGVKVRVENNVVLAKFTKVEMCFMQGCVNAYTKTSTNMEDTKFAMALYDKMQPLIEGMTEDE